MSSRTRKCKKPEAPKEPQRNRTLKNTYNDWPPRNRTMKIRKPDPPSPPIVERKKELPFCWDRFLIEGDELYNYMINNFDTMLTADSTNHFDIRYGIHHISIETDEFREKYARILQKELVTWIRLEHSEGRLFNKDLWKPFRDSHQLTTMYFGYKKMFHYIADDGNNYYLQLAMEDYCENICITCDDCCDNIHFELIFFGYRDEENKFQPLNVMHILDNNFMSERYWNRY